MKSLKEIQWEFLEKRLQKNAEIIAPALDARKELDVLLQTAGIKDGPDDRLSDDAEKWNDPDYYRCRVREMVFRVPDFELRRQIMRQMSIYQFEVDKCSEMFRMFADTFAAELRQMRCQPSHSRLAVLAVPLAVMCVAFAYWGGGAAGVLVAGFGLVLPALVLLALDYVGKLHRHDVTMQEAIKHVEREASKSESEASRLLYLPELFSRREQRTGEAEPTD